MQIEAALHLARLKPATLILAVRDSAAGDAAHERIKAETSYAGKAEVWTLDLASFASVKSFAARCLALERLDVRTTVSGHHRRGADEVDRSRFWLRMLGS